VRRGEGAPPGRYTLSDATVFDTKTMLTWERKAPETSRTWAEAESYCGSLSVGGVSGWRMPRIKELQSLVDIRRCCSAIDHEAFPEDLLDLSRGYLSKVKHGKEKPSALLAALLALLARNPERRIGEVRNLWSTKTLWPRLVTTSTASSRDEHSAEVAGYGY